MTINTNLTVIDFVEDNINILYSPALELYGYGQTHNEAKKSFKINLEVFLDYAIENNTLFEELERLGWKIAKDKKNILPPPPSYFIKNNPTFQDLWQKPFKKFDQPIQFAMT